MKITCGENPVKFPFAFKNILAMTTKSVKSTAGAKLIASLLLN
jgi:hypothetical protein